MTFIIVGYRQGFLEHKVLVETADEESADPAVEFLDVYALIRGLLVGLPLKTLLSIPNGKEATRDFHGEGS